MARKKKTFIDWIYKNSIDKMKGKTMYSFINTLQGYSMILCKAINIRTLCFTDYQIPVLKVMGLNPIGITINGGRMLDCYIRAVL